MRAAWPWLALLTLHYAGAAGAAVVGASPPFGSPGLERGIASLRCTTGSKGMFSSSRAAILDVGPTAEVLLATAHGLPADAQEVKRNCRVIARGKEHGVTDVWHAGGDRVGPEHDWAVIVTERLAGDVHRWRVGRVTGEGLAAAVAERLSLRLVLRSADAPPSDCKLETLELHTLVAHSCHAHPGMSGSPMVVALGAEPEPVLFAIHIGTQMRWAGTKLDFVSVARPLDAEVAAAIEAAMARAAAVPSRRREPR